MPHIPLLNLVLWLSGTLLQASVLVLFLRKKLRKEYPFFLHYTIYQICMSVAFYGMILIVPPLVYFYSYWSASAISFLLGFAVIYEIFNNTFKPYDELRDFGRMIFQWATLVLVLVAVVLAFSARPSEGRLVEVVLSIERSVMVMQAGMLLFLMLFSTRLGISWRNYSFGIALGFGIYACCELGLNALRASTGTTYLRVYEIGSQLLYAVKMSIWLTYLAAPEPVRATAAAAFAPKPFLERWNQGLRQATHPGRPEQQHAYISSLESLVQQVMEEKR